MRTQFLTTSAGAGIWIGSAYIFSVILTAIAISSTAEQVGLSTPIRMDLLFLSIFLVMVGGSYLLGKPIGSRIKVYLRSHLDGQGHLTETQVVKRVERRITYLFLCALGLGGLTQSVCEKIHVLDQPLALSQTRDCYVLANALQAVLIGCFVGLLLASYWAVRSLEKECGCRVHLKKPTKVSWGFIEIVVAIGFGFFVLYAFYKIFTLGR